MRSAVIALLVAVGCGPVGAPSRDAAVVPRGAVAAQMIAIREGRATQLRADEPLTEAEWEMLGACRGVREIVLERGMADDRRVAVVAALPHLERLVLRESPLTDEGFRTLAACASLRDLNVPQAACTPAGIRALAALPRLRSLRLGGPHLEGAEVCAAVVAIEPLVSLHLIDVPIGDDGLRVLAGRPDLGNLYLDGAGVSDEGWAGYFRACPDVHVHVDQAHHDRDPRRDHQ